MASKAKEENENKENSCDENHSRRRVELKLLSVHDIELEFANCMTVMPSTGDVVVHGVGQHEHRKDKYSFHVYSHSSKRDGYLSPTRDGELTHYTSKKNGELADTTPHKRDGDVEYPSTRAQKLADSTSKRDGGLTDSSPTRNGELQDCISNVDSQHRQKGDLRDTSMRAQKLADSSSMRNGKITDSSPTRNGELKESSSKTFSSHSNDRDFGNTSTRAQKLKDTSSARDGELTYRQIPATCQDDAVEILPVTVKDGNNSESELLAVACPGCQDIRLLDLQTGSTRTVYSNPEYKPDLMCHGENGTVYVYSLRDPYPVLQLGLEGTDFTGPIRTNETEFTGPIRTKGTEFTGPIRTLDTGLNQWCTGMCYIPSPYRAVVLSVASESLILAISVHNNELLWKLQGEIDVARCNPWGLMYSRQHEALFVCDGDNVRVLVLHPRDGTHLQTIPLPRTTDAVYDISLRDNQVVLLHRSHLSVFSMK